MRSPVLWLAFVASLSLLAARADYYNADYYASYDDLAGGLYDDIGDYAGLYDVYDDFDYGFDGFDGYGIGSDYGDIDFAHYYDDEYDEYYEQYGTYADEYGGDYFFDYEERVTEDCTEDATGAAKVNGPLCNVKIEGMNAVATQLPGGLDGVYVVHGCWNGHPKYSRQNSPPGENRTLFYSKTFSDWDLSTGSEPDEAAVVMYGGDGYERVRPNFVEASQWHVYSKFTKGGSDQDSTVFAAVNLTIGCADGSKVLEEPNPSVYQPLISADEMEAKYRAIYTRYGRQEARSPGVNVFMILFVLAMGVAAVLVLPQAVARTKRANSGGLQSSLLQSFEEARKRRTGHTL